ncbi:golgin candidate 5 isoform X7 [Drosophila eugracilis]|uniref:golgin candidate 5 isoform X7 n=1 Tax=Drosophila eugracilis TaxID=29029 RepID=UPI001BDA8312|nr:golgin candidate 5 isoform X7 [Drosophila eugracilis]
MYEKTLNIGTAKVNNAYEWQKVRYNNKPQPTTTTATAVKVKQQQLQKQKNATKAAPTTTTTTAPPLTGNSITVKQGPKIKFVGNAARRQSLAHQIKRAHRHLLTSGGQDKQPQQKQKTQVPQTSGKTVAKAKPRQKQLLKSDKAKEKPKQQRKRAVTRNTRNPRGQSESSGLSSRWCSIEEQLNLLDDLLYYCDEEAELYLAQLYERFKTLRRSRSSSVASDFWSDSDMEHDDSSTSGTGSHTASNNSLVPSSLKRRGHQHHPRFSGTRRPNVPNVQEILAALYRGDSKSALSNLRGETQPEEEQPQQQQQSEEVLHPSRSTLSLPLSESVTNSLGSNSPTPTDESSVQDEGASNPAATSIAEGAIPPAPITTSKSKKKKREKGEKLEKSEKSEKSDRKKKSSGKKERSKRSNPMELSSDSLATDISAGAIDEGIALADDDDNQAAEWSKLRCTSEAAEIVAEREARRNKGRCADYPGLAFGRSIFSSDTMMKFNIIRNELHNIMNTQLKRAESEVAALNRRIQLLEEDLERSEERLGSATAKLSEASQAADESERIRKALENRTNMEDDKVALLENQLAQAKLIAEEADKKYEEVARKLVLMEQDLERSEEKVELSESKIVELEEELRVVGNNLKSLEVSEEKANQREEEYKNQIKTLNTRLKEAEARAEFAERSVQKLQKEVDRLEDDLLNVRGKNKLLQEEMEATLHDIQNM